MTTETNPEILLEDDETRVQQDGPGLVQPPDQHRVRSSSLTPGLDYYGDGMRYVDGLVEALRHVLGGDPAAAAEHAWTADCILAPLGDENHPERLRDFIAGAARAAEHYLEECGVPIQW